MKQASWIMRRVGAAVLLVVLPVAVAGQRKSTASSTTTAPMLMLSDLHFDPLHDPAKVPLLVKAPIAQWSSILAQPASPDQPAHFASLQSTCNAKQSMDTPYALLQSSLAAAKAQAAKAAFVTVSGDLLVHDLDCRYRAAMGLPASTSDDQSVSAKFAEETTAFVVQQIESTFPTIPVYLALGNNDSRCNHNRLDIHDDYLASSASAVLAGLRGVSAAEKAAASQTYRSAGYYAVTMAAPMRHTRLIVIDDIYMMPKYTSCEAVEDNRGADEQAAWLQKELESARRDKQLVWIMGHLPPTVNADSSLSGKGSFCSTDRTVRFQTTDDLANQITANADTIKLGIFGHTHMDELHLLRGQNAAVPVKVVPSISPVDGNRPSFTVGSIDPSSGTLVDYAVYEANNTTGVETRWTQEYAFDAAYGVEGFNPASLRSLIERLRADKQGTGNESRAYREHFLKGATAKKLSPSWPGYVCSLDNATAKDFKSCVCAIP